MKRRYKYTALLAVCCIIAAAGCSSKGNNIPAQESSLQEESGTAAEPAARQDGSDAADASQVKESGTKEEITGTDEDSTLVSAENESLKPFRSDTDYPMVETESGKVLGYDNRGTYTFLGIPYAKAERFMMPEPVGSWDGIYLANSYGEDAPIAEMSAVASSEFTIPHRYYPQSEDCQFLNIWSQSIDRDAKKPVMVWLHGGGFDSGSSVEMQAYDGTNLSDDGDVVVVSLNHRLNVLGFLDLSDYGEEYKYSGNAGMADIVAALEWIQRNIENFGGDPDNVTIFGQSGGGVKVMALMGMPAADGLFHKAIIQSCVVLSMTKEESSRVAALTLENLGLGADQADKLKDVPYDELIAAGNKTIAELRNEYPDLKWAPVIDGDYLPVDIKNDFFSEQSKDIPLIIGSVMGEITSNSSSILKGRDGYKNTWDEEKTAEKLSEKYGDNSGLVLEKFIEAYPDKNPADAYFTDGMFRNPEIAYKKADQGGADVYLYNFTYESPVLGGLMAWHCSDIPYIFRNIDTAGLATGLTDTAYMLQDVFSRAWVRFAYTGSPNGDGLPEWEAVTRENGATMVLDETCEMRYHYDDALIDLIK